ncbi:hypothetical protein HNY73_007252 [Argiope bruennichi]|uniref:Uncharacterized protein n=1 Tax=Argiope bruennichi TaxID=94029 RepID=A0A8T0FGF7_ARGBR|nr:hypothetical protein HNY73_007252 [Argiope bruennichi]
MRINDIPDDIEIEIISRLQAYNAYVSQLDESTDVAGLTILLVFVRSNKPSWSDFLGKDGLYPNKSGDLRLANYFCRFLKNCISSDNTSRKPANDAMPVSCIVEELRKEPYNPMLIFKLQKSKTIWCPAHLDNLPNSASSFALGLQTKAQKDMLVKHSGKILCIDATHGTNFCDFYLLSLHVQD